MSGNLKYGGVGSNFKEKSSYFPPYIAMMPILLFSNDILPLSINDLKLFILNYRRLTFEVVLYLFALACMVAYLLRCA